MIDVDDFVQVKEVPKFNEFSYVTGPYSTTQPYDYSKVIDLIKKTPEVVGILKALQTDICSDGYTFEGKDVNVKKAIEFAKKNRFKNELAGCITDWLWAGNGALWKGKVSKSKIKEVLQKVQSISGIQVKEAEVKAILDEDVYTTKMIRYVPWSTMNIDLSEDKASIAGFRQTLQDGSEDIEFTPEEIIHGKYMEFDGRMYGFSPAEAAVNVISTLSLIKDMNGNFFQNGGVPDFMFILPEEMAGSPNVKKLEQVLQKYKSSKHKHGNLVFTGKVETVELNHFDKDMEFRQLAIYYTGILAFAFNMPIARISSIIGAEVKGDAASTDLANDGYWRSISSAQDYWEDLLNSQLFEPEFKVKIKFNRGYRNDEIKEAQRDVQALQVVVPLVQSGFVDSDYLKVRFHIPDEYWNPNGDVEKLQAGGGFGGSAGSPGSVPENDKKGLARQEENKRKTEQAKSAVERKELIVEVDFEEFNTIIQKFVKKSTTRRIHWLEEGKILKLYVETPDTCYYFTSSDLPEPIREDWRSFSIPIKNVHTVSKDIYRPISRGNN